MGWTSKPSAFTKTIEADLTKKQKDIVIDALGGVVMSSAVDTGAVRANNRIGIGSIDGKADKNDVDEGGQRTLNSELSKLVRLKPFQTVYISNSLPYAYVLNYGLYPKNPKVETGKTENGYSRQDPTGFYETTFTYISEKYR
ncbi:TPA: hypothetical protein ACF00A_002262 [Acinetobacter nosocomialis]|jgi:hypothetical protein|uniref:Uncharacterized protein n=2 Tax=Acinetobacter calcoaceticus/baumannii complex TaxID=909768 RepID=A0AAV3ILX9_ACINO|nr:MULTISPECIES: hypothetical protein [Acinetobacter calcoaceticus/baumannii complex]ENV40599.1 hypothetical protein F958_03633 [Acinetobacter nosocomialis NIPH 386]MDH2531508.1 hypothetical protein [Acinetobacter baumannii]HAB70835.1 hypothetical protein [Acinetobacter nosocomialis]